MKTFLQWADESKKELPNLEVIENTKRAGIAHWAYPDAYIRSQYPDQEFMTHAADAMFKMGKHQPSRKAAPANTPG